MERHCIGFAACFSPIEKQCKKCDRNIECATVVLKRLITINESVGVGDLIKRTLSFLQQRGELVIDFTISKKAPLKQAKSTPYYFELPENIEKLSRSSRTIAKAIIKNGIDMKQDARLKRNSFDNSFRPTFMGQVQELVNTGKFTKRQLKEVIAREKQMTSVSVKAKASSVTIALEALGIIRKYGEDYETLL